MSDFKEFVTAFKGKRIAIGMHRNADLDALCSAFALRNALGGVATIVTPDEMNGPAKALAREFGMDVKLFSQTDRNQHEGIVVVDSSSFVMISEAKKWPVLGMIDHHQKPPEEEKIAARDVKYEFWDSDCPSTCQIIARILEETDEKSAFALAIGMISDTARFKSGNVETFEQIARMLRICKKSYAEALSYAEPERLSDEKMFIISAFKKAEAVTYREHVIAITVVHARESDASASMSEFADIAFAASWRNDLKETRVSSRARKNVNLKLNEIMRDLGQSMGGTGGGHAKAAGMNAKGRPEEVLAACVDAVKDALDGAISNISDE